MFSIYCKTFTATQVDLTKISYLHEASLFFKRLEERKQIHTANTAQMASFARIAAKYKPCFQNLNEINLKAIQI